ncbi:MAG: phosphate acyltransferase [Proteobacteria bacterium]|nr:phosphate acyltransferase [Pseudomonadota bacterium]
MTLSVITKLTTYFKTCPGSIILPEGEDPRIQNAAIQLSKSGCFQKITLMGPPLKIRNDLSAINLETNSIDVIDPQDKKLQSICIEVLEANLIAKGRVPDRSILKDVAKDSLYIAGALVKQKKYSCALAGATSTTSQVIRAALHTVGLRTGFKTVSGSFILERIKEGRLDVFCFGDCGVVIDPSIDQLVDIAKSSADTFFQIANQTPKVAFLSFSTKGSAVHPMSEKTAAAANRFQNLYPEIACDGELQFDAATVLDVGKRKAPKSLVAGQANVLIFPDLNAGNIAYKIAERLGGFRAYGPILQGLSESFSDLSRGATADDIASSAIIGLARANSRLS